jgi:hypothetical protein
MANHFALGVESNERNPKDRQKHADEEHKHDNKYTDKVWKENCHTFQDILWMKLRKTIKSVTQTVSNSANILNGNLPNTKSVALLLHVSFTCLFNDAANNSNYIASCYGTTVMNWKDVEAAVASFKESSWPGPKIGDMGPRPIKNVGPPPTHSEIHIIIW